MKKRLRNTQGIFKKYVVSDKQILSQIIVFHNWQKRETMLPAKLSLVLLMMVAVNFSLANPVKNNVEEDLDMNNAMEGNYKLTRSAEFIDEEDSKKASWETSRYFFNEIAPLQSLMILKIGERSCTPSSCPLSLASLALTGSTSVSPGSTDNFRKNVAKSLIA